MAGKQIGKDIQPGGGMKPKFADVRDKVINVFERIGGEFAMAKWAQENPTLFYTQVLPRFMPREIAGKLEVEHKEVSTLPTDVIRERTRKYLERRAPAADDSVRH